MFVLDSSEQELFVLETCAREQAESTKVVQDGVSDSSSSSSRVAAAGDASSRINSSLKSRDDLIC